MRAFVASMAMAVGSSLLAGPASATASPVRIPHVVVINLENEAYSAVFGRGSVATYLNGTLVPKGVLITHYFGTAHMSLPNYLAEVSGMAPNPTTQADCGGSFADVKPGTPSTFGLGQVKAKSGCVYPADVQTIADQLDAVSPPDPTTHRASWRAYQEDMGNDPAHDGGSTCAHPAIGAANSSNYASRKSGYAARHDPFVWFHSVIDRQAVCDANVVALGSIDKATHLPSPSSPLAQDFSPTDASQTPAFSFITPSLCNDGHDEVCTSKSAAGGSRGGLEAADAWLSTWVPTLLASKAAADGSLLVVITMDESSIFAPKSGAACCGEASGPNVSSAGLGFGPGGGRVGALLIGPSSLIAPGTRDVTGRYNHYSLLRSVEDLLGITTGGSDGQGHLGMAGSPGLASFGADVFNARTG